MRSFRHHPGLQGGVRTSASRPLVTPHQGIRPLQAVLTPPHWGTPASPDRTHYCHYSPRPEPVAIWGWCDVRLCLMIEGQEGVSWEQWMALARGRRAERARGPVPLRPLPVGERQDRPRLLRRVGDAGRARGPHAAHPAGHDGLPGDLPPPLGDRQAAADVDHVSGGRVELGLGAGWYELEHQAFGFPFPPVGERMEMLEEQLEIVHRQWTEDEFSFRGKHYSARRLPGTAQARAAAAAADRRRRRWQAAHGGRGGPLRPGVQHHRGRAGRVRPDPPPAGRGVRAGRAGSRPACVLRR